jgi:hypothetical protein
MSVSTLLVPWPPEATAEARKSRLFLRAVYRKALRSKLGTSMRWPFLRAD